MRCCYGVHSMLPQELVKRLPKNMTWCAPDAPVLSDIVIVTGIDQLRRAWPTIADADVAVIVFDAEVNLQRYCIPDLVLDRTTRKLLNTPNTIKYVKRSPIKKMLSKSKSSFVGNFTTYTYKIADLEKRTKTRVEVFNSIWMGRRLQLIDKTHKKAAELLALLSSKECVALEIALQEIRNGKTVRATSKKYRIPTFDLEYVARQIKT